jgi:hypothetical protein
MIVAMSGLGWRPLDYERETAWLLARSDGNQTTGIDASGWDDHVWVLHTMYESEAAIPATWDDLDRAGRGDDEDDDAPIFAGIDLREVAVDTGIPLGFSVHPGLGWHRLRWHELALRTGVSLDQHPYPPCLRWFPYRSWPASVRPPAEGSIDEELLTHLVPPLVRHAGVDACIASYSPLHSDLEDGDRCFRGPITGLIDLLEVWPDFLPSNVWAPDRSWLLYTDADLLATKVSGSRALVTDLVADAEIETIRWAPST